jgi:NitT/TauT family transport system substrate-binding protein
MAALAVISLAVGLSGAASAKETVKVAHFSWAGYGFLHIVKAKNLAPDIDLEISIIEDPVQSFALLSSGQLDIVTSTIEFGPIATAENMPVKVLGLTNLGNGSDRIIVHPDIKEAADLKGKQVAVLEGGLSQIYMAIWLEQNGVRWDEVEMVNLIAGDAAAAMMSGQLAAAELWDPYGLQVLEELPGSRQASHSGEEYWLKEGLIADAIFVSDKMIEERRDVLVALTKARYDAVEWWRANPAEGNQIISDAVKWPIEDVQAILGGENNPDDGTLYMYSLEESARFCGVADGAPPFGQKNGQMTDHWELTNKWWVTFGLMTETIDAAKGVDCSIFKAALGS